MTSDDIRPAISCNGKLKVVPHNRVGRDFCYSSSIQEMKIDCKYKTYQRIQELQFAEKMANGVADGLDVQNSDWQELVFDGRHGEYWKKIYTLACKKSS